VAGASTDRASAPRRFESVERFESEDKSGIAANVEDLRLLSSAGPDGSCFGINPNEATEPDDFELT
jgi:hypothetical protein